MKIFKIKIFDKNNYYFHTEEIYCESLEECTDLYMKKYPNYNFDIKECEI